MKCKICGRELKSLESMERGCGPTCAKKDTIKKENKIKGWFK